jgi:hypothetical protein
MYVVTQKKAQSTKYSGHVELCSFYLVDSKVYPMLKASTNYRVWGKVFLCNLSLALYYARGLFGTQDLQNISEDTLSLRYADPSFH